MSVNLRVILTDSLYVCAVMNLFDMHGKLRRQSKVAKISNCFHNFLGSGKSFVQNVDKSNVTDILALTFIVSRANFARTFVDFTSAY